MADTSTHSWKLLYEAGRQALQARKLQDAEQSFSAALQLAEDFAPGDPRLSATLNALARIYSLQRRYLAAAALLNRLLEVTERTLGPAHVQVAGVLTNLAEMYTHLGAAREELELRERALAIRADDPNADTSTLQRLRERVTELHATLAAQEASSDADEEEIEPLPIVRTAEYSAPMAVVEEPAATEPVLQDVPFVASEPATTTSREDPYRLSPAGSQLSVAPWPSAAATSNAPTGARPIEVEDPSYADLASYSTPTSSYERSYAPAQPARFRSTTDHGFSTTDHGFSDMGRDELAMPIGGRFAGRTRLLSVAAGVALVAVILAARSFVATPDDERGVSAGSVSLANGSAPTPITPVTRPSETPDPRSVERLMADQRAERETKRANDESREQTRPAASSESRARDAVIVPRVPDIERTLRGVDGAVKVIDQRAKAVTDSASALRLQAPTFKRVKVADP